jgi:hypothetical protein
MSEREGFGLDLPRRLLGNCQQGYSTLVFYCSEAREPTFHHSLRGSAFSFSALHTSKRVFSDASGPSLVLLLPLNSPFLLLSTTRSNSQAMIRLVNVQVLVALGHSSNI